MPFRALAESDVFALVAFCDSNTKLLRILGVQTRPTELHCFATDDTPDRIVANEPIEDIEADVPAGCGHRYEAAIDVMPERETRAVAGWLELKSLAGSFNDAPLAKVNFTTDL